MAPRKDMMGGWAPGDVCASSTDTNGKLPFHRALEAVASSSMFDEDVVHHGAGFDAMQTTDPASSITSTTVVSTEEETVCPRSEAIIYDNSKLEGTRVQIIHKLLQWHPRAIRVPFSNGRSPLLQAIAHGGSWHGTAENGYLGLLSLLWGHAPGQSLEIDPVTGLHPFMLAAAVPLPPERECEQTDTVFNLLRKDPQLVSGALRC